MNKYLTELIGTFLFVLSISLAVQNADKFAPLVIGCALMIMVYMGGHVSGGHYNPAVSLGVLIRGKMDGKDFIPYVLCQVLGAVGAGLMAQVLTGKTVPIAPGEGSNWLSALLAEVIYTFALVLVVLNVATAKKTEGNSFYGLAIGFTIVVAAFSAGGISGGAFNPAVGTGLTVSHAIRSGGVYDHLWLYWAGPLLGGLLAALIFKAQESEA